MATPGPATDDAFLDRLSPDERDGLFAIGTRRRYPINTTIFFIGEPALEVLVILNGEVKAVVPAIDGRQVILDVLGPGALLGEVASIDGGDRSATIHTLGQVEVLAMRSESFDQFLTAHPVVLRNMATVIASRLRESDRRQLEFGTGDAIGRVCARLVEMAARYGQLNEGGLTELESPLSQSDLASWSGLSREAIVKAMRALRTLGWIENDGRSITILELDKLRERADS